MRAVELSCTITVLFGSTEASCASSTAGCTGMSCSCSRASFSSRSIRLAANARILPRCRAHPAALSPCSLPSAWVMPVSVSFSSHCAARSSG